MQADDQAVRRAKPDPAEQAALRAHQPVLPHPGSPTYRMIDVDATHLARMKQIIDQVGWPGRDIVGTDGAHAAWLLVQHADRDVTFQQRCLTLMREAVAHGNASDTDLAYLIDRVAVNLGQPQTYGTQFRINADGLVPATPINDPDNLDQRRRGVGLGPYEDYLKDGERQAGFG